MPAEGRQGHTRVKRGGGGDGDPPKANRKAAVCRFSLEGDPGPDDDLAR